jgi:hypothetical protein
MAEVMEQLDAARDDLLDEEDHVVGRVKDVKAVEKRLRQCVPDVTLSTCQRDVFMVSNTGHCGCCSAVPLLH